MAYRFSRAQLLQFAKAGDPGLRVLLELESRADDSGLIENVPQEDMLARAEVSHQAWNRAMNILIAMGAAKRLPREFATFARYQLAVDGEEVAA